MAERLTNKEARAIMAAANLKPLTLYESVSRPWPSICLICKHEVSPTLNNVKKSGKGCGYCAGNLVHPQDALKVMTKAGLETLEEFPGASKPWKCRCTRCGAIVSPRYKSVRLGSNGCNLCGRAEAGLKNRISEETAREIMLNAGLVPLEPYESSSKPWKSQCRNCKRVVTPRLAMVKSKKSGCAYCAGRRVDEDDAMLLMKENNLQPLEPYQGNKHPWRSIHIPCGREVSPRYNGLKKGQGPCKFCAGVAVEPLEAERLFISKGLKPLEPYPGDNKKPWRSIHTDCGNEVSPNFNIIQQGESNGCHFCSDQFVDPEEAYQFFLSRDLQPLVPYPGTAKPWKSIHLICGSEIKPRYGHIKSGRVGCLVCAGTVPISQERAFKFFRLNGLEPLEPFEGPHVPWRSIHKVCGKEVSPRWASVQQGNGGCIYCSGGKVDLKDVMKVMDKLKLKPLTPFPGSSEPWKCIHLECGAEVSPRWNGISRGQGGCINCGKNLVVESEGLKLLAKNKFIPLSEFPGGSIGWRVLHEPCGTEQEVLATYLRQGGKGCSTCSRTKPITSAQAVEFFKSRGFKPIEPFKNSRTPMRSVHLVCGNVVSPTWGSLKISGGCKYCSTSVVNLVAPAYFYLITSPELNAHKVGISGHGASMNRLERHKRNGWITYAVEDLDTGEQAYQLEEAVLLWLREDKSLPRYLVSEQMPQGGHTETVNAGEISLEEIWIKVQELRKALK